MRSARATFAFIGDYPSVGAPYGFDRPSLAGMRMFPVMRYHKRFCIFYKVEVDEVRILYVYRVSRDIAVRMGENQRA